MKSDDDDDYEISNKNVEDYLNQFQMEINNNSNTLVQLSVDVSNRSSKNQDLPSENIEKKQAVSIKTSLLFQLIEKIRERKSDIFFDNDNQYLLDLCVISTTNKHEKTRRFKEVAAQLFLFSFSALLGCLFLNSVYFAVPLLLLFLVTVKCFKRIKRLVLIKSFETILAKIEIYLNMTRDLFKYLKQTEQISLSSEREFNIRKSNKIDLNLADSLNFKYRKMLFHEAKSFFFEIKNFNCQQVNELVLEKKFPLENSIFKLDISELSVLLQIKHSDPKLDTLTDFYSLSCIGSMLKLCWLIVSENVKLLVLAFLSENLSFIGLIRLAFRWIQVYGGQVDRLRNLEQLLKLVNSNNQISEKRVDSTTRPFTAAVNLSLYLRNALLNTYYLVETENSSGQHLKAFHLVKRSFENASLYLEQLELSLNKVGVELRAQKKAEVVAELDSRKRDEEDEKKRNELNLLTDYAYVAEDEVLEAEVIHEVQVSEQKLAEVLDSEEVVKEKENLLASKNLFYELKYALKTKSNEWKQREKEIVMRREKLRVGAFELAREDDHLLENDALKYKAQLKYRKQKSSANLRGAKMYSITNETKKKKYVYENENEKDEAARSESEQPLLLKPSQTGSSMNMSRAFLCDFMKKRDALLQAKQLSCEEAFGDPEISE